MITPPLSNGFERVSSDGGQSSLNYLFGGGHAPKPALKATQAAPCETPAANNVSAANTKYCSFSQGKDKKYTGVSKLKLIEILLKVVVNKKNSNKTVEGLENATKRLRKSDQPNIVINIVDSDTSSDKMKVCNNSACRAKLNQEDAFFRENNIQESQPKVLRKKQYSEDDHEVNSPQTETEIGSTSHDTSITRNETRALNEAKKMRLDKGKLVFEIDEFKGNSALEEKLKEVATEQDDMKKWLAFTYQLLYLLDATGSTLQDLPALGL
nr:VIN3-like protein 2 [Tanacetum cinerariifolium]